jgi:hypothetical protein
LYENAKLNVANLNIEITSNYLQVAKSSTLRIFLKKLFFGRAERKFQDGSKGCDKDCDKNL